MFCSQSCYNLSASFHEPDCSSGNCTSYQARVFFYERSGDGTFQDSYNTAMKFRKLKLPKKPKKLKLAKLPTRWVLGYLIALVPVIRLARLYDTNPAQFWLEAPFLVSSIMAIFAGISALLASRSLKMTEKALELTTITMRPFLTLQPGDASLNQSEHIATLEFHVKNTGPVPANLVTAETAFFDDAEVIKDDNESKHYPKDRQQPQGIVIFPDATYNIIQRFDLRRDIDKKLLANIMNGKVKARFRVTYRAQSMEYVTVQTEKLEKEEAGGIARVPIQPQRWT